MATDSNFSCAPYPDSGDNSPPSREIDAENPVAWDDPPPASARVKLMISYGGRIQPRPHDHLLSYVSGDTKILSIDRSIRFPEFYAKLSAMPGADDVCIKYQLPGEDLDALVSVTNDEDLEYMILEYDRLHHQRSSSSAAGPNSRSTPRLRVFLFPIKPPPPPSALLEPKSDRQWYFEVLNAVPPPPQPKMDAAPQAAAPVPSPPQVVYSAPTTGPDYLFGLDNGFVPPPAVKIIDPAGDPPIVRENVPVEALVRADASEERQIGGDPSPVVSPAQLQRQIQELEKLQLTENQKQPPAPAVSRNGSEENLARAYPPPAAPAPAPAEYFVSKFPEKPPVPATAAPTGYLPVSGTVVPGRYTSVAGGDHPPVYLIQTAPGVYQSSAPQGYFVQPGTSFAAVYAMAPQQAPSQVAPQSASAKIVAQALEVGGVARAAPAASAAAAAYPPPLGYDSAGRAVYYTSVAPPYPTVTSVALSTEAATPLRP